MTSCVQSTQVTGPDAPPGENLYVLSSTPDDLSACTYVVQSGSDYVAALVAQELESDMFFAAAVVVLFALGWIAGAQR